jgi:hypothetical protein
MESSPLLLRPFIELLYESWMIHDYDCGTISGMNEWQGKPKCSKQTHSLAFLSAIDQTCLKPRSNSGCRSGNP